MKATNFARASYQEVYDIMTKDGKVSMFGFHTPTGLAPYKMLSGFFRQFRKYRYTGMSATLIPAAQLPADPLQISYSAGTEGFIDPRDLQNPILFHGIHGNSLGSAINRIYSQYGKFAVGTSADLIESPNDDPVQQHLEDTSRITDSTIEEWYYTAMLDPSFRKFNVMSNIKLPSMAPRVHQLATDLKIQSHMGDLRQIDPETYRISGVSGQTDSYYAGLRDFEPYISGDGVNDEARTYLTPVKFMSSKLSRLGWLDTFTFAHKRTNTSTNLIMQEPVISVLPKLFMGVLIMPPSYRTQLCFRMVLTHYFEFSGFNTAITVPNFVDDEGLTVFDVNTKGQYDLNYHNWLPESLTEATAISDSVDAINGEVTQTVTGVM